MEVNDLLFLAVHQKIRSFKVTHFGITEKLTRDCVLLYNNVSFRVGNFEGKV